MNRQACTTPTIYLNMGEIVLADKPATITTVLGSCVAVTLFDRTSGLGAMCHGVMPACESAAKCTSACEKRGHYVECSVVAMARWFRSRCGVRAGVEARVFGGAEIFLSAERLWGILSVGPRNIEAAKRALSNYAFSVSSMIVGGRAGRRIYFDTRSGEVTVQQLNAQDAARSGLGRRMCPV